MPKIQISEKNRKAFKMIVGYLKAGGSPSMKFIHDFCRESGATVEDLMAYVKEDGPDYVAALHKFGLL